MQKSEHYKTPKNVFQFLIKKSILMELYISFNYIGKIVMLKNLSPEERRSEEITIISAGVKIEGKVKSNGNIRVEGEIQGDIVSQGNVVIGSNGEVNGQINGDSIAIGGNVTGTVRAKNRLTIEEKGNLQGDIFTKSLIVKEGAKFDGKCKMGE
jgi:cytoskeletal protein CcmA (bactofilin family)